MKTLINSLICSITLTLSAGQALAENLTWDGDGDNAWSGANWWNGAELTNAAPADDLLFSGRGAVGTVNVSGSVTAASGTFTASGYTFSGGTIWFNNILGVNVAGASGTTVFDSYVRSTGVQFTAAVTANQTLVFNGGGAFNGDIGANTNTTRYGTMILNSGTYATGQYIKIGDINNPDTGVRVNTGATLQLGNIFFIGYGQNAMVNVRGGLMTAGSSVTIGRANTGRVLVDSGTFQAVNNPQYDPLSNANGGINISILGGTGILDIANTGVVNAHYLAIARDGTGTVNLGGGEANIYNTLYFGAGYGAAAVSGSGRLNVSGGILRIGQGGIVNAGGGTFGYQAILSGGTISTTGTAGWSSAADLTLSDADGGVTFDADQDITLGGILDGEGGLTKAGAGTLLLSGANTYAGDTIVNAGALELGNASALGLKADLSLLSDVMVDLNYTGVATIDHLLLDGVIISNLSIDTAYTADELNIELGSIIFSGNGQLTISAIPEPSVLALLILGLIGMAATARFKARRQPNP
jgi:autotransporter-associated beta strand protein